MQSVRKGYQLVNRLPTFSLCILKQCCACSHGDAAVKPYSAIPGPKPWPIIGSALEVSANRHHINEYFSENFKKYGDIYKVNTFGTEFVLIKDPDSIEHVLRAEGKYPICDKAISSNMYWLTKNKTDLVASILEVNGEEWKRIRSAIGKQATPRNVQTYCDDFNKIFDRFMDYIRNTRGEDRMIPDIAYPLKLLLVEISAKFVFGNDITVVSNPTGDYKEFVEAINTFFEALSQLVTALPLYKLYNNKLAQMYGESMKVIGDASRKEMKRLYARLEAGEESETPGLLEQWLREGKISEEQAIREAITSFTAGVDTTANQSAFLLYYMAKHPEVQERLYQEVREVMGDSKHPTPQQLSQMPYMKGCILESFRLASTAAAIARITLEDTTLHGYRIPADTTVLYSTYSAGRDEKLFTDPLKFDPDRWRRDEKHAFAIQPFGFGPRMCYGRRFAELEIKLLLVQVASNFELSTPREELTITHRTVGVPEGDVPIAFVDRVHAN